MLRRALADVKLGRVGRLRQAQPQALTEPFIMTKHSSTGTAGLGT
jgi:hypothetical protein